MKDIFSTLLMQIYYNWQKLEQRNKKVLKVHYCLIFIDNICHLRTLPYQGQVN